MLKVGNNAEMEVDGLKLTRYACYLSYDVTDIEKIISKNTYMAEYCKINTQINTPPT